MKEPVNDIHWFQVKGDLMGKNGALMRANKQQNTVYTFTREQLAAHDAMVIKERKKQIVSDMLNKADEINQELSDSIHKEWESREKLFSDKGLDANLVQVIALLVGISARTLVEDFGWEPLPKDGNYRKSRKLARFCQAIADRVANICDDENTDIRTYNAETYDLYGVKFEVEEAE